MNIQNQEIDYKPSIVGKVARVIIPVLQTILPVSTFKIVYDNLYWLNKRRIWITYSVTTKFYGIFGNKELKTKQKLTRFLLPYTMGGWKALENAFEVVQLIEKNKVPGVIIECGVAEGGTAAMMALTSRALGNKTRHFWFFDSYEGLPEPTAEDYKGTKAGNFVQPLTKGSCLGSIEQVSELLFGKLDLPKDKINLVQGWFQDTIAVNKDKIKTISILRLDGDWYESTKIPLENFYSHISPGGCVIIDDYATCFGSRKATDEFIEQNSINTTLRPDGRGGAWFVKP